MAALISTAASTNDPKIRWRFFSLLERSKPKAVQLIEPLRTEQKFKDVKTLQGNIAQDAEAAKAILLQRYGA